MKLIYYIQLQNLHVHCKVFYRKSPVDTSRRVQITWLKKGDQSLDQCHRAIMGYLFLSHKYTVGSNNLLITRALHKTMQLEFSRKPGFRLNQSHSTSDAMATRGSCSSDTLYC